MIGFGINNITEERKDDKEYSKSGITKNARFSSGLTKTGARKHPWCPGKLWRSFQRSLLCDSLCACVFVCKTCCGEFISQKTLLEKIFFLFRVLNVFFFFTCHMRDQRGRGVVEAKTRKLWKREEEEDEEDEEDERRVWWRTFFLLGNNPNFWIWISFFLSFFLYGSNSLAIFLFFAREKGERKSFLLYPPRFSLTQSVPSQGTPAAFV